MPANIIIGLLVLLCSLASAQTRAQADRIAPVETAPAMETEVAREITLSGTVTAVHSADLSVATGGLVTLLKVDAGSQVNAGDVLLELDPELAQYQYDSALAVVTQAERAVADAKRRYAEAKRLAPQRSIAESVVRDLAAEVAEDQANLEQVSASAGYRQGILERHRLRAPFAGVISSRSTDLGEWVNPGQSVLGLVSSAELRLDFQVPEDFSGQIDTETPVSFSLGSRGERQYKGTVQAAVPVSDPRARTFLLRVEPREPVAAMIPGMSVRARLQIGHGQRGLSIPGDAVIRHPDGRAIVWVVKREDGGEVATERRVQIGESFGNRIEIRDGLRAGDQVIVKGNESLRSGQQVSTSPAKET